MFKSLWWNVTGKIIIVIVNSCGFIAICFSEHMPCMLLIIDLANVFFDQIDDGAMISIFFFFINTTPITFFTIWKLITIHHKIMKIFNKAKDGKQQFVGFHNTYKFHTVKFSNINVGTTQLFFW